MSNSPELLLDDKSLNISAACTLENIDTECCYLVKMARAQGDHDVISVPDSASIKPLYSLTALCRPTVVIA